jgi:hypothetical protein
MAKLHMDRLRKKYGALGWTGGRYRALMEMIISSNHENVSGAFARRSQDFYRDKFARIKKTTAKQFKVPPMEEVMPRREVYLRKGAERGRMITDALRDKLSHDLRSAVAQYMETGAESMQYHRGENRGRMRPELVAGLEQAMTHTFDNYTKAHGGEIPANIGTIANTEVRAAVSDIKHTYAKNLAAANPGALRLMKRWIHHPTFSKEPRFGHGKVDQKMVRLDQPFMVPRYEKVAGKNVLLGKVAMQHPHDPAAAAEDVINCLPGDSVVFAKGTEALLRSWYSGRLISIKTANGLEFSTTANHPVLTDEGWIEAERLVVGGDVICVDRIDKFRGSHDYINHRPAMIRKIFDFPLIGGMLSCKGIVRGDGYFHGERGDREVDIKTVDRILWDSLDSPTLKEYPKFILAAAYLALCGLVRAGLSDHLLIGRLRSPAGIMGGHREGSTLVGRKAAYSKAVCGLGIAPRNPQPEEFCSDGSAVDRILESQGIFGDACLVGRDKIIEIRSEFFAGHVFNLHTASNIYGANRDGNTRRFAVLHNCHCECDYVTQVVAPKPLVKPQKAH